MSQPDSPSSPNPAELVAAERDRRTARQRRQLQRRLPELAQLERLLRDAPPGLRCDVLERIDVDGMPLPVYGLSLGPTESPAPLMLLVGGVHGLERIGTQVILAFLHSLFSRYHWDSHLQALFGQVRLAVIPVLNPGGMWLNQRSNPAGVDLMRNAPIRAQGESTFLLGGQRLTPRLPWYTGEPEKGMEPENRALARFFEAQVAQAPFALSLDCHSGFGLKDRLWFPYAYRRRPMRRIASVMALKLLWEQTYPNHDYLFEPQSTHYLTHGDLWDHFYKQYNRSKLNFIPLTLELGSWRWVRKRPRQLLSLEGLFNPLVPHRRERALRRHLILLEFLLSATVNHDQWLPGPDQARQLRQMALTLWYKGQ